VSTLHKLLYTLILTRHLDTGVAPLAVAAGAPWVEMAPRRRASTAAMPAARSGQSGTGPAVRSGQSQTGPAVRSGQSQTGPKVTPPRAPMPSPAGVTPPRAPMPSASGATPPRAPMPTASGVTPPRAPMPTLSGAGQTGRFLTREEIEAKLANVDAQNHYELLELPLDASPEQVSQAFPSLARRWHPDRLSPEFTDLRDAVTRVFARMTEANRVLSNPGTRKTYDESLGAPDAEQQEQEQVALVLRSAEAFQKAEILLKKRDLEGAELLARTAHEGDPEQPEYAALYAFIRARRADAGEEDLQSSLAMLKKALAKQTNNVKIHYYLACVLKAAGQTGAAMREYRHVAEHDPSNVDAAREIRLHEMRRGNSKQPPADPGLFGKIFKR
jgi:curved DNA-binding protein CbpA